MWSIFLRFTEYREDQCEHSKLPPSPHPKVLELIGVILLKCKMKQNQNLNFLLKVQDLMLDTDQRLTKKVWIPFAALYCFVNKEGKALTEMHSGWPPQVN